MSSSHVVMTGTKSSWKLDVPSLAMWDRIAVSGGRQ
jgi:hypothetical protein